MLENLDGLKRPKQNCHSPVWVTPSGVTVDADRAVYVTNVANDRVLKLGVG